MTIIQYSQMTDDSLRKLCESLEQNIIDAREDYVIHPQFFNKDGLDLKAPKKIDMPMESASQQEIYTYLLYRLRTLLYKARTSGQQFILQQRKYGNNNDATQNSESKQFYEDIIKLYGMIIGELAAWSEVVSDKDAAIITPTNSQTKISFNKLLKRIPHLLGVTQRNKQTKLDEITFSYIPKMFITDETMKSFTDAINNSYCKIISFFKRTGYTVDSDAAVQQFENQGINNLDTLKAFLEHYCKRKFSEKEKTPQQDIVAPVQVPKEPQETTRVPKWVSIFFGHPSTEPTPPSQTKPVKLTLNEKAYKALGTICYICNALCQNIDYSKMSRNDLIGYCNYYEDNVIQRIGKTEFENFCREKNIPLWWDPIQQEVVPDQPNLSQIQKNATEYTIRRLKKLEIRLKEFLPLLEKCNELELKDKCSLFEHAMDVTGKILAEFAILAVVIQNKDVKNIKLGIYDSVSLKDILIKLPYILNITSIPKKAEYGENSCCGHFYPWGHSDAINIKYAKTRENLFAGITNSWVPALQDLHDIEFITFLTYRNGVHYDPNRQGASCIKTPIDCEFRLSALLQLYFGTKFHLSYEYYRAYLETWTEDYAQPLKEDSMLPTDGNYVVANLFTLIEKFGELTINLHSDVLSSIKACERS